MKYWEYRINSLRFLNIVYAAVIAGMVFLYFEFFENSLSLFIIVGLAFFHAFILILVFSFVKLIKDYYKYYLCVCLWACTMFITDFLYMIDMGRFSVMHILLLVIALFSVFNKKMLFAFIASYLIIVIPAMVISPIKDEIKYITGLSILIIFILFYIKYSYDDLISKAYEDSLKAQRSLLDNAQEAFILFESIKDEDGNNVDYKIVSINNSFKKMIGVTENDVIGKQITEILPDLEKTWFEIFDNIVKTNEAKTFTKFFAVTNMFIRASIYPISDGRLAILFSDVSNEIQNERKLRFAIRRSENADKLKNQFLKDVNHRLRTPLNGIMGMLQLIEPDSVSEDNKQLFDAMTIEVFHIRNIINQISKYVDIQSENFEYSKNNLREIISDEMNNYMDKELEIEVIEKGECGESIFYIQKELIVIVFRELLKNAIKHTINGKVQVVMECEKNIKDEMHYIHLGVRDFGKGIAKEQLMYVFNEFYHHDFINIYKEDDDYSIPICKQMLLSNGGDLFVESQVGLETVFTMLLPVYSL